jgi:hypothetical protein
MHEYKKYNYGTVYPKLYYRGADGETFNDSHLMNKKIRFYIRAMIKAQELKTATLNKLGLQHNDN